MSILCDRIMNGFENIKGTSNPPSPSFPGRRSLQVAGVFLLFICALVVSFAALALRARAANDTTRAQINNIRSKSHVIIIIINKQGRIISRMRVLIIQAK